LLRKVTENVTTYSVIWKKPWKNVFQSFSRHFLLYHCYKFLSSISTMNKKPSSCITKYLYRNRHVSLLNS
jgi:hypothetical protein